MHFFLDVPQACGVSAYVAVVREQGAHREQKPPVTVVVHFESDLRAHWCPLADLLLEQVERVPFFGMHHLPERRLDQLARVSAELGHGRGRSPPDIARAIRLQHNVGSVLGEHPETLLRLCQLPLRLLELGDVDGQSAHAIEGAVGLRVNAPRCRDPADRTVGVHDAVFRVIISPLLRGILDLPLDGLAILGMHRGVEIGEAGLLVRAQSQMRFASLGPLELAARHVPIPDAHAGTFGGEAQAPLRSLPESRLRPPLPAGFPVLPELAVFANADSRNDQCATTDGEPRPKTVPDLDADVVGESGLLDLQSPLVGHVRPREANSGKNRYRPDDRSHRPIEADQLFHAVVGLPHEFSRNIRGGYRLIIAPEVAPCNPPVSDGIQNHPTSRCGIFTAPSPC